MLQAVRDNVLLNKLVVHAKKVLTQSYKTHCINIKKIVHIYNVPQQNDCHTHCGSNDFLDYFDDAKESRVKQIPKLQESSFKESRFKNNQVSRFN